MRTEEEIRAMIAAADKEMRAPRVRATRGVILFTRMVVLKWVLGENDDPDDPEVSV